MKIKQWLIFAGLIGVLWVAAAWPSTNLQVSTITGVRVTIVGSLGSGFSKGTLAIVTDGTSASDCSTGGSSTIALCAYSGSAWSAVSSGSGVTSVSADGTVECGTVTSSGSFTLCTAASYTVLQNDTSGSAAPTYGKLDLANVVTGTLPGGNLPNPQTALLGGLNALPTMPLATGNLNAGGTAIMTALSQNQVLLFSIALLGPTDAVHFQYDVTTADNSANVYDLGMYGPGCTNGATNIPLVVHTGATAGTSLFAATGVKGQTSAALVNWTSSAILQSGWYAFAITSSASSPAAILGGASGATIEQFANHAAAPQSSSGGVLPSTITCPALSYTMAASSGTPVTFFTWGP